MSEARSRSRTSTGQFSGVDELRLREMVRAVAAHARREGAETVTTRLFDGAREGAGMSDCPKASAVREHLNRSGARERGWREWLALLEDDSRDLIRTLEATRRPSPALTMPWEAPPAVEPAGDLVGAEPDEDLLDARPDVSGVGESEAERDARVQERLRRLVHVALHVALLALPGPSLTAEEYGDARHRLLVAVPARAELMPTPNQLLRAVSGDWGAVLEMAGLPPVARPGHLGVSMSEEQLTDPGLPAPMAVVLFVKANGAWPGSRALRRFCALADIALADHGAWADVLEEAEALLEADGVPVPAPERQVQGAGLDSIKVPAERAEGLPGRRPRQRQTRESCVRGVLIWLRELRAGQPSSSAAYRVFSVGKDECPAPSRFQQFGGWSSIKAEAVERLAAERQVTDASLEESAEPAGGTMDARAA